MFSGIGINQSIMINYNSLESFMCMFAWRLWHPCWHLGVESPCRLRTACVLVRVSSLCGLEYFGVPGSNNQEMYASGTIITF